MRLIDADALIRNINEIYEGYMTDECGCVPYDFERLVDVQPTAYDIDKVVEELKEMKTIEGSMKTKLCFKFDEITVNRAIVIVKQGLKEQNK